MNATPEVRCPFCDRINRFEYEAASPSTVRFEPLNPVTPGHMLFVPGGHIEHGPLARDFVAAAMGAAEKYGVERGGGFNLIISSGPDATQTVAHVHVHYVPRRPGDGLPLPWTPQQAAVTPVVPQGAATPADPGFEVWQRLARAAFQVDSTHHFHEGPDGRPVCVCGFVGSARKRSQTEHITAAVLEAFDHD